MMTTNKIVDTSIAEIESIEVNNLPPRDYELEYQEFLASYSYIDSIEDGENRLTIPAINKVYHLDQDELPVQLEQTGFALADENACRFPLAPMDPAIEAIKRMGPKDFDIRAMDFIMDRNTFRKMHEFVRYSSEDEPTQLRDRCQGVVHDWVAERGFGFLMVHSPGPYMGRKVFCHVKAIKQHPANAESIVMPIGMKLQFDVNQGVKGPQASNVRTQDGQLIKSRKQDYPKFGVVMTKGGSVLFRRLMDPVSRHNGYGKNFESRVTYLPEDWSSASGMWNINHFKFAGFDCVIRAETDCLVAPQDTPLPSNVVQEDCKKINLDDGPKYKIPRFTNTEGINEDTIVQRFTERKEMIEALVGYDSGEIKCYSPNGNWKDEWNYVQMTLGGIRKLILATQRRGYVDEKPVVMSKDGILNMCEIDEDGIQQKFAKMGAMLARIRDELKGKEEQPHVVEFDAVDQIMKIYPGQLSPVSQHMLNYLASKD